MYNFDGEFHRFKRGIPIEPHRGGDAYYQISSEYLTSSTHSPHTIKVVINFSLRRYECNEIQNGRHCYILYQILMHGDTQIL